MTKMEKLNIWGSPFGDSGYAIHTKNLALALKDKFDVGIEASNLPPNFIDQPEVIREMCRKNYISENTIMINTAEWWSLKYAEGIKKLIGFGVFEGDKIQKTWVKAANDEVLTALFVPSQHTKDAFVNSGVTKQIFIIPHGVDEKIFKLDIEVSPELVDEKNFTFLYVGGWKDGVNDRKGLDIALRAFVREFRRHEKVRFMVKVNFVYKPGQNIYGDIEKLKLGKEIPESDTPQIGAFTNQILHFKLAQVYASSDCLVMPTKADAFCMPCLEAASCGIPIIANSYGGQSEYLAQRPDSCFLIEPEGFAKATGGFLYEDSKWSVPSIKGFQEKMRYVFENSGEIRKKAKKNAAYFTEEWSWKRTAEKVEGAMKSL